MEEKIIGFIQSSVAKNPGHWMNIYRIFRTFNRTHLQDTQAVGSMVDSLAGIFEMQLSSQERSNIIHWLIERQIDPQSIRQFCSAFLQAYFSQQNK